jgi:chromosome condensin MukBEF MukE localization factor
MWVFSIPRKLLRLVERMARAENVSEIQIVEEALKLLKENKLAKIMQGGSSEDTIWVATLRQRVTLSMAKQIVTEINRYFGREAMMQMTSEERKAKARKAALARWRKEKRKGKE